MGERKLVKTQLMPAVYREWLAWLPVSENTKRHYGRGLRRVISFADVEPGNFTPASLDEKTVKSAFSTMQSESVADVDLKQCLAALKSFFDYCNKEGHLGDGVVPDIDGLRLVGRGPVSEQLMPAVYREWLAWLSMKEHTKNTIRAYGQGLRRMVRFADIPIRDFGPASLNKKTVIDAETKMQREGVADAALKQCYVGMRSFLDYCKEQNLDVPDIDWQYLPLPEEEDMPQVYMEWLKSLPLREDKPETTIRAYGQGLRRLVYMAGIQTGGFEPALLDQKTVIDAVTEMRRQGVSKATLNQCLAALNSFFDYCKEAGNLGGAIPPDVRRIRKISRIAPSPVDPEYFEPAQLRRLYEAANWEWAGKSLRWEPRDFAMCSFLAVLGLRASELTALNVGSLPTEHEIEEENANWVLRVEGKGRKIRQLPLSNELFRATTNWKEERAGRFGAPGSEDPLFVTNSGKRFNYQQLRYWFMKLNEVAGNPRRTLHSLRHTAGVQLANDGVPMNAIQKFLGHASIATTGIYTELAGGELVGILERSQANSMIRGFLPPTKNS